MNLDLARAVADAVLYEGYLLYPYRASSDKNRVRWQFGVLGPPGAAEAGVGEQPAMAMQTLLTGLPRATDATRASRAVVVVHLRFLQLQRRQVLDPDQRPVEELRVGGTTQMSWDEAREQQVTVSFTHDELAAGTSRAVEVPGGEDIEELTAEDGSPAGRVVRRRWPLTARLSAFARPQPGGLHRLELGVTNHHGAHGPTTPPAGMDKEDAIRRSLIGAHLLVEAHGPSFLSLLEPPEDAGPAAAACTQRRCWPVLTGAPGDTDLVLGSPIILYDYPEIAQQSAGALFDATEIDEILTLRVMTMTDEEKAEARATDPHAREIIDRCDAMSPEDLQQLHGVLRNPHAEEAAPLSGTTTGAADVRNLAEASFDTGDVPWWDPEADAAVQPELDGVTIEGVRVSKGSLVRVHPQRRADAQDLFFADQVARVSAVLSDVDGGAYVALVLVDDPAADMHDWYGRYFYFAPDEVAPLSADEARELADTQPPEPHPEGTHPEGTHREESRP